ncbi:MAG: lysophospholipid transporter LplT [Candidatus Dactylopiibacterium carminicum]|uniref:Lysophospholipid transporter LplT n=1 Tax=Candidatus Dactylopiibacterium carminicum TaxID=857335 RepID=A0A272EV29_9RHOO|nr:lysophospholipid transporter LplT [Candidatus Dactylopiibacterium carminicum]KAF7599841.1 lysophospholipid transporter LplT [Candidatus Dactylopiibacterium carminicum]PAS93952.1 MAG: lysophospholipid transporter LplT [Candidatus Dactylopiibacterium carminicum]PAS99841.1 MAG: lysophospholipid transporter LplT [Candidatus Dactylopiibacterium carminicum]
MGSGFYLVMAAQFFSALADNALLIAAIALLMQTGAPAEQIPLLKFFFTISYVVLAAFVGAFADSMPKARVMLISNTIKIGGCALMFFDVHPLAAYAVVGLGAAAYSPAKYGILTEMLPPGKLVIANGWIEGLTVGAIILGTLLGGVLIHPHISNAIAHLGIPQIGPIFDSPFDLSILGIGLLYLIAAGFNAYIPDTGVDHKPLRNNPLYLIHEFSHCVALLWRDRLGQISLAVTTLFWGAGATLQFIVLDWAAANLQLNLSEATSLQGVVALGVAVGSVLAAKFVTLRRSPSVIPLGIAMGIGINIMVFIHHIPPAMLLMVAVGTLAGFFVVPMNALLQHRGHVLMGAGHSIAVQNFNENLSILAMTGLYALLIRSGLSVNVVVVMFGMFIAGSMWLVRLRHLANQREFDAVSLLEDRHH